MMAAVFKFVSSDQTGPKRLQTSKACDYCRRRKKRCNHGENASGPPSSAASARDEATEVNQQRPIESQTSLPDGPKAVEVPQTVGRRSTGGVSQLHDRDNEIGNNSSGTRNARFIGDLNPEGIFLAATSPDATRGTSLDDSIGVW